MRPGSKYERWYTSLMERARSRPKPSEYVERHHVLPAALGGGNAPENLVYLTYREHFLAHWLLARIHKDHPGNNIKMFCALDYMRVRRAELVIVSSWQYEIARRAHIEARRGKPRKPETVERLKAAGLRRRGVPTGHKMSESHKKAIEAGYRRKFPRKIKRLRLCACGCGKLAAPGKRYVHAHASRLVLLKINKDRVGKPRAW